MKRVLFIPALFFLIASSQTQNEILPVKSSNSILYAKDVKIHNDTAQDQRTVNVCSAANGWLYAFYSYMKHQGTQYLTSPDFDTLSVFVFQVVGKQRHVKFAPPFWVAQASEIPTFAYVHTQKEESLGYYQYRRCRKAQWYLPGDYYHRHQ